MKQDINEYDFMRAFEQMDRQKNFEYDGLKALYEYLIQLEDDIGEEIELDVISLCCDFARYEDIEDFLREYGTDGGFNGIEPKDYDDTEEFEEAVKQKLWDYTTIIDIDGTAFIIQVF